MEPDIYNDLALEYIMPFKQDYLISEKSDAKYIINHNFARIRIDSNNYLPIEKVITFHNVIILIKSE